MKKHFFSALCAAVITVSISSAEALELTPVAHYGSGIFNQAACEISSYDPTRKLLFTIDATGGLLRVFSMLNPTIPVQLHAISVADSFPASATFHPDSCTLTSVAATSHSVAVAMHVKHPGSDEGIVVLFGYENGLFVSTPRIGIFTGYHPDMLCWSADGTKLAVACEGEIDALRNAPGSIWLHRFDVDGSYLDNKHVILGERVNGLEITSFGDVKAAMRDSLIARGVVMPDTVADPSLWLEPEYLTFDSAGNIVATLQENNALAIVDIDSLVALDNLAGVDIVPLGLRDCMAAGKGIDASDKDGILIANYPVKTMYQPDAIVAAKINGKNWLFTANEGDSWEGDDVRIKDVKLASSFTTKNKADLARLKMSRTGSKYKPGTDTVVTPVAYGGRGFSVLDSVGKLVWESGDEFEQYFAQNLPAAYNMSNDNNTVDDRSDDKGPEAECIAIGTVDGTPYAFIGLERIGGVMVYDVSVPTAPEFVTYVNNRDYSLPVIDAGDNPDSAQLAAIGDLGPESILFLDAARSPTGSPVIVVSNEISGSITQYALGSEPQGDPVDNANVERSLMTSVSGTLVWQGGYGSGLVAHPELPGYFYMITDRGPNVDDTLENVKIFVDTAFIPQIGLFRAAGDSLELVSSMPMYGYGRAWNFHGLPADANYTSDSARTINGTRIGPKPYGLDPEGLDIDANGNFYVSDEYEPAVKVFNPMGTLVGDIYPTADEYFGTHWVRLPEVLRSRRANRGMEGVCLTPSGDLVGMLQSPCANPTLTVSKNSRSVRIAVVRNPVPGSYVLQEFLYRLDSKSTMVSDIKAINDSEFVVLERDGNFPGDTSVSSVVKRFYRITLHGATDVHDPLDSSTGLFYGSSTLEQLDSTGLAAYNVKPVVKTLFFDLMAKDPDYPHDKPEGFVVNSDLSEIWIVNDDDFGITGDTNGAVVSKVLPATGEVDRVVLRHYLVSGVATLPGRVGSALKPFSIRQIGSNLHVLAPVGVTGPIAVTLFDLHGRAVDRVITGPDAGRSVTLPLSAHGSGFYIVKASCGSALSVEKIRYVR